MGHRAGLDRCGKSRPQPGFDPRPLFTSGKNPVPIVQEAGWATGPVWTGAENLAPPRFDPRPLFTPRKDPVPIVQEAGWAPGPVWTRAENLASHRDSIPRPSSP